MRKIIEWLAALVFVTSALAQIKVDTVSDKALYIANDLENEERWCAFSKESDWKSASESLKSLTVARVEYKGDRIAEIYVTERDEAGDWTVYDAYSLDESEKPQSLKRTMNVIPGDRSEEELWLIKDGRATKQRSTSHSLSTLKPVDPTPIIFPEVPIVRSLQGFPFWRLIRDKRREVLSKGRACIPDR